MMHSERAIKPNAKRSLVAVLLLVAAATASAEDIEIVMDTPAATIRSLQRGLIAVAAEPGLSVEDRYARLLPLVTATHDLGFIAELAIRRHWDSLDADQQSRYLAAFEALSVMTYASRFGNVSSTSFLAATTRGETGDSADVSSGVRTSDGGEVSLEYALRPSGASWRIINIVADGVSDLALKRAEYRRILTEQGIEPLIEALGRQTDELRGR